MNEGFRDMAERRPRAYGALLVTMGASVIWFLHGSAQLIGRVSLVLVLVAPFMLVFGVQALVLGTTPSQLKGDRVSAGVMFALSGIGSVLLWRWL